MTLTKKQLAEARTINSRHAATEKWKKISKKERSNHAKKMVEAREYKKKLSTR